MKILNEIFYMYIMDISLIKSTYDLEKKKESRVKVNLMCILCRIVILSHLVIRSQFLLKQIMGGSSHVSQPS